MGSSLTLIRADSSSTWLDFTTRLHTVHVGFVIVVKHSRPQQLRLSPVARTKNRYFPHVLTGPWTRPVCCTELRPRHYLAFFAQEFPVAENLTATCGHTNCFASRFLPGCFCVSFFEDTAHANRRGQVCFSF